MEVVIVGGGIGGLTLGLMLHQAGIPSRIFEAVPDIKPLGSASTFAASTAAC